MMIMMIITQVPTLLYSNPSHKEASFHTFRRHRVSSYSIMITINDDLENHDDDDFMRWVSLKTLMYLLFGENSPLLFSSRWGFWWMDPLIHCLCGNILHDMPAATNCVAINESRKVWVLYLSFSRTFYFFYNNFWRLD